MLRIRVAWILVLSGSLFAAENSPVSVKSLLVPPKARDRFLEGEKLLAKKDTSGARRKFTEAVEIAPDYAAAWNALGVLSSEAAEKELDFRRALECDSENLDAHLNLGAWLLRTNRPEEALAYNKRVAMELPSDPQAQMQFGMNLYQIGKLNEAERVLIAVKRIDAEQHHFTPQLFLGEIYARRGEKARALAELEDLLAVHPDPQLAQVIERAISRLRE